MKFTKKANIGTPLVYAMLLLFIVMFITVAGTYYLNEGKLNEETNQAFIDALDQEQQIESTQDETMINKVIDWFGQDDALTTNGSSSDGGTLEERLYSEQNQKQVDLQGTYSIIKKAPTIIGVTIFGFSATSVFITFLISCVVLYLAWIGYKELKSFFGRN